MKDIDIGAWRAGTMSKEGSLMGSGVEYSQIISDTIKILMNDL